MKYTMHTFHLPSGRNDVTCRDDAIVQIGNTEVTHSDIKFLAAHLEECEILNRVRRNATRKRLFGKAR